MRKFLILLKKELKELLTLQVIAPLVITAVIFMFLGNLIGEQQEKIETGVKSYIIDQDNSQISKNLIQILKDSKIDVIMQDGKTEEIVERAKKENVSTVFVIPSGFAEKASLSDPLKIDTYTIVRNFSMMGGQEYGKIVTAIASANEIISSQLIYNKTGEINTTSIKMPIQANEYILVGNKQAHISPAAVMGFVSQQTMFIPIILFFVIVFASQMIATAIANEKENKTLETLLTTPVSRNAIVVAKMTAAGLIALLGSVFYMFGFKSYIGGIAGNQKIGEEVLRAMESLGLTFQPQGYLLLGIALFLGILIALAISLILGAFAEDVKSVAGLTTPLMVLVMIPYFLTMFFDINALPNALKMVALAIPFSHVFLAAQNIFLENYQDVIFGIFYLFIWVVIFVLIAARIFSTDRIVTMKLNFSKKKY